MPLSVDRLLRRLSLRQLQVFHAVYTLNGFGKAADLLGLTQPAVSSQIRHLEGALGHKVFEVIGRKVFPTAAGEMVAQSVAIIFEQLRRLQNDIDALEGQVSGDLRIAAVNSAQYVVPYLLKGFTELYPKATIRLSIVNRATVIERLSENKDDLVIMGIVPQEKPLSSLPFLDNELIPVVSPRHPLRQQKTVQPADFLAANLLVREPGSGSRLALEQHCQQHRLNLEPAMVLGSNDALKHAVIAGMGVAVLPRLSVLADLRVGALAALDIQGFPLRRSWCVVYPSSRNQTLITRYFIDFVQQNLTAIKNDFDARVSEGA